MTTTAKLFKNGRSQAVRLPREFRFEGDRVRVRRAGRGVLVEPMFTDVSVWFAELDRLASEPFMPEGRQQVPAWSAALLTPYGRKPFVQPRGIVPPDDEDVPPIGVIGVTEPGS